MAVRSAWLLPGGSAGPGQTREDTRVVPLGTMTPDGPLSTRSGVIPGGNPFATSAAGAMSLQVGPGRGVAQGTTAQGAYPLAVTSPETVTFTDGDASYDRIDTIVLRVLDGMYDVSGDTLATIEVVEGQPTDTPQRPDIPSAALPLWDVRVEAGTSSGTGGVNWATAVTDRRVFLTSVGGIVPIGSTSQAGSYDGQYMDLGGVLYRWSASTSTWQVYRAPELAAETFSGSVSVATGWSLNSFGGRRRNGVVQIVGYFSRTGNNITRTASGNVTDTVIATIPATPSGWRPVIPFESMASNGYGSGSVTVETNGQLLLRTWEGGSSTNALEKGTNLRVTATFVV